MSFGFFFLQKIDYASLLNDDEDDEDFENGQGETPFDSDDDDVLLANAEKADSSQNVSANTSDDLFNSLKSDDPTPKKAAPAKRKLGSKAEVVKAPAKRSKSAVSDSDDSPVKVCLVI